MIKFEPAFGRHFFLVLCFLIGQGIQNTYSQTLFIYPAQISAGYKIVLPPNFDTDKSSHCAVFYRTEGSTNWLTAYPPDRIISNSEDQFRGSLFFLDSSKNYELKATITDSFPALIKAEIVATTFKCKQEKYVLNYSLVKYVSPTGSGNKYTKTEPGNFKTLIQSGQVTCGTTIIVMDGIYSDINIGWNINVDCSENTPITIVADAGAMPIFDGGQTIAGNWKKHNTDTNIYYQNLPANTDYTNLCMLNNTVLFPYPTVTANILFGNYNLSDLNLGNNGFVRDNQTIYIKTKLGLNPNLYPVTVSKAFRWLTIYGNNHNLYLHLKGIVVKNIAKSTVSGTVSYTATALDVRSTNHVWIDSCQFYYNNSHLVFTGQSDYLHFEKNYFEAQNGLWSHSMVKKSNVENALFSTSMARTGETGAIEIANTKFLTVNNNFFNGVNSGIVSGFNTGLVEESDIFSNLFENNYDAIECDGNWCNLRAYKNKLIGAMAAFSLAPPLLGPRYFYRNIIYQGKGRKNVQDDPYFIFCKAPTEYWSQSVAIKTNSGEVINKNLAGNLYFFNNTFYGNDTLAFAVTSWDAEWKKAFFKNNIYYHKFIYPWYFQGFLNKDTFQLHSEKDNFYCENNLPIANIKEIHGQYKCHEILLADSLNNKLNSLTKSKDIHILFPVQKNPLFVNSATADFRLQNSSTLINAGTVIPGFYDFIGDFPDIGALETDMLGMRKTYPTLHFKLSPNPAHNYIHLSAISGESGSFNVSILNTKGQVLLQKEDIRLPITLPLNGLQLNDGIYLIQLKNKNATLCEKLYVQGL